MCEPAAQVVVAASTADMNAETASDLLLELLFANSEPIRMAVLSAADPATMHGKERAKEAAAQKVAEIENYVRHMVAVEFAASETAVARWWLYTAAVADVGAVLALLFAGRVLTDGSVGPWCAAAAAR